MIKHREAVSGRKAPVGAWLKAGCVAGFAGGLAEVAVMGLYSGVSGLSSATILSLITATFTSDAIAFGPLGAFDGLMIHFVLSVAIGAAFGILQYLIHKNRGTVSYPLVSVTGTVILVGIWAFNFFVLLPQINPAFVAYVPLVPSFVSKFSFGLSLCLFVRFVEAGGRVGKARLVLATGRN
ncbi:MAG: hypothetical protein A3J24_01830 [Deltaproteobacteria bacterium RIFCSPLOWO2_02_FULL_53_8]|nr:MAG: hypothetical protein A3J24_01830 [Deltaproteobacteria bacterium RIFCSPLOWO2_02_FULL_53_8]